MAVSAENVVVEVPVELSDTDWEKAEIDFAQLVEGYKIGLRQRFSMEAKALAVSKGHELSEVVSRTKAAMLAVERGLKLAEKRQIENYTAAHSVLVTNLENAMNDLVDSDEFMIIQGYIFEAKPELLLTRNIAIDELDRGIQSMERGIVVSDNLDLRLLQQLKLAADELRNESDEDIEEFLLKQHFNLMHYTY